MPMRLGFAYSVPITTTSTTATRVDAFGDVTVRLASTADCWVSIGPPGVVATVANSTLIRSSVAGEMFTIGNGEQVAVISTAAGGTLNVTEMSE